MKKLSEQLQDFLKECIIVKTMYDLEKTSPKKKWVITPAEERYIRKVISTIEDCGL